jgi:predicted RNA-binding protein with RPS1 domain
MQLEVGQIVEGKVTGFTAFGAFIDLDDGKKRHGSHFRSCI